MAQVFVTGGSGFIGQVLIRRLIADQHDVRALVRSAASADTVAALGATPVRGELTEPDTWRDAVRGSEVLFHLAAETDLDADLARHQLVTVDGTRAALHVAREAKVARFVNCGSEAALLAGDPLVDVDETAPLRPDSPAPYCAVKAQQEALVLAANTADFTTVSIRPKFVWGPGSLVTDGFAALATAAGTPPTSRSSTTRSRGCCWGGSAAGPARRTSSPTRNPCNSANSCRPSSTSTASAPQSLISTSTPRPRLSRCPRSGSSGRPATSARTGRSRTSATGR